MNTSEREKPAPTAGTAYDCAVEGCCIGDCPNCLYVAQLEREHAAARAERDAAVAHLRVLLTEPCMVTYLVERERDWCMTHQRYAPCPRPERKVALDWLATLTPPAEPAP